MAARKSTIADQLQLQAGIKDRLERLSTLTGVPLQALASHAIENWLAQQERTLALIESLGDAVGGDMGTHLKDMLRRGLFARQLKIPGGTALTDAQIGAIAEQEGLSTAAAAGLGSALLQSREGLREIARLIGDNIQTAKAQGQSNKAEEGERILDHFKQQHAK